MFFWYGQWDTYALAMTSIRVKKFDPSTMLPSRIIYMIGKRGSGKSYLMRDILSRMPNPDYVLAMAPTQSTLEAFREFLPPTCIFNHFSQEKLERTMLLQRELTARGKVRRVLIILDDCLYQPGVLKSTVMKELHFNGRHEHVGLLCCAQYLMSLPPEIRTNVDYLFTLKENVLSNRQKLHKNFFGQYDTFADFDKVMTACTQDYRALVMDNTVASTEASDVVMWYKADPNTPPFRLCRPIYWRLSRRCGRSDDDVRREQSRQFEMQTAAAEAMSSSAGALTGKQKIAVEQTEDEHGKVVTSSS